jgi:hypothetical protein
MTALHPHVKAATSHLEHTIFFSKKKDEAPDLTIEVDVDQSRVKIRRASGPSHASSTTIGATSGKPQKSGKPPPLPMACIRYYRVVPRDAGCWVGCWGRGQASTCEVHQLGGAEGPSPRPARVRRRHGCLCTRVWQTPCYEAQPRMIDVYRAWDARGADMGVVVADSWRPRRWSWCTHGACRDPPPVPTVAPLRRGAKVHF